MGQAPLPTLVVCPGRGVYNRGELGYLRRHYLGQSPVVALADQERRRRGQSLISDLDAADRFDPAVHTRGDNASLLIFASSYADFLAIDRAAFDIVAVTGNSMGWYTALACAGALSPEDAVALVNTMGRLTHEGLVGGQVLFTLVDEAWRPIPGYRDALCARARDVTDRFPGGLHVSIELGGMIVFAGQEPAIEALMSEAPPGSLRPPLRLPNHSAFHSPLMAEVADEARALLSASGFRAPQTPLIDGRGRIWRPGASARQALWDYTLGAQVLETYDFTSAVQVAVKEFAPRIVIVLGPGDTLGGAVAQSLAQIGWGGVIDKPTFLARQASEPPLLLSMGREDQRPRAVGPGVVQTALT